MLKKHYMNVIHQRTYPCFVGNDCAQYLRASGNHGHVRTVPLGALKAKDMSVRDQAHVSISLV